MLTHKIKIVIRNYTDPNVNQSRQWEFSKSDCDDCFWNLVNNKFLGCIIFYVHRSESLVPDNDNKRSTVIQTILSFEGLRRWLLYNAKSRSDVTDGGWKKVIKIVTISSETCISF